MPPPPPPPRKTGRIVELHQESLEKYCTKNVTSRENVPHPIGIVFQRTIPIFKLSRAIIKTNILTEFHKVWIINVTSRVLTMTYARLLLDCTINVTSRAITKIYNIFELDEDSIGTHVLTKFHEDWIINVASRMLTI
ncbi:hypothetical protein DPMN_007688 [Dreissena polymorpha]|uniref:Uncharacterized protein n=1 Tax=Dreissena polymorpha TaxID=45954 RepID=A0A9D4MYX5_DREPO|nr:hypothetical protein DPMN_007688 [Dreissena polymorpha]